MVETRRRINSTDVGVVITRVQIKSLTNTQYPTSTPR